MLPETVNKRRGVIKLPKTMNISNRNKEYACKNHGQKD